eukprot:409533_1
MFHSLDLTLETKAFRVLGISEKESRTTTLATVTAPIVLSEDKAKQWSADATAEWIRRVPNLKMAQKCVDAFVTHDIDGETLFDLTLEILRDDLGINIFADRNRIMKSIRT